MKHLKSVWSICLALAAPVALAASVALAAPVAAQAAPADDPVVTAEATSGEAAEQAASPETAQADDEPPPAPPPPVTPPETPPSDVAATNLASPSAEGEGESPAASEDESQAAEAQAAAEPLAWRNSFFSYSVSATFNSLCRDCQLSYNPNVYQFFSFTPRWYLDASTFLFLSFGAFYEFTDSDGTAYNHEFSIGDLLLELRRTVAWEGFIFIPAARVSFPTSKLSQAAQRYANVGVGVTVVRPIPEALGMTIAGVFRYQRWLADSNVSLARGDCFTPLPMGAGLATGPEADTSSLCNSVVRNESDRLVAGVSINVTPVEHFTINLSMFWVWAYTFDGAGTDVPAATDEGSGFVRFDSIGGNWRNFTSYSVSAAYDFTDWLNISLTVSNSTVLAPLYADNGSVLSPFNPDTQFSLGATFTLDGIYNTLNAGGEDDGLTPEERQRRRQGLASLGSDEDEDTQGSARSTASTL